MSDAPPLSLPSPFDMAPGHVLLREPPDADPVLLIAQLLTGSYPHPFVVDDGEHLTLYLGSLDLMQTVMSKAEPDALLPGYGPRMMMSLLFLPAPRHIAMIGLGGGALVKFCLRHLAQARITVLELDEAVIAWRDTFGVPADGARLQVLAMDGAAHVAASPGSMDLLMIDAFDTHGFAPALASREFVVDAFEALTRSGMLVVNLAGPSAAYADFVAAVGEVFDDRLLVVPASEDGNHVLLAFKDPAMRPVWQRLHRLAAQMAGRHGLDYPAFVTQAERVGWRRVPESLLR
jgi:spermidine synthase